MIPADDLEGVLAEIRDELREQLGRIANAIEEHGRLETLPELLKRSEPQPEIVHAIPESTVANLLEALGLVRLVLDTGGPGLPGSPNSERLFEAEHLLSKELGQPVWEGRRTMKTSQFLEEMSRELDAAEQEHAPMASAHEAWAVIFEELDEFWEEVRKKQSERTVEGLRRELVQTATMAWRAARDLGLVRS